MHLSPSLTLLQHASPGPPPATRTPPCTGTGAQSGRHAMGCLLLECVGAKMGNKGSPKPCWGGRRQEVVGPEETREVKQMQKEQ